MNLSNSKQFPDDPMLGESPHVFYGIDVPDGDLSPWYDAPVGSIYIYQDKTNGLSRHYVKAKEDGIDNDWTAGLHVVTKSLVYSDFTDGGAAAGTYVLEEGIPVGAYALQSTLVNVTGFTGNTSCVITVGDGTDGDRYNTGTPSVFASAAAIDLGAISGTKIHATAANVTITLTANSDWGLVTAGALTIRIYCLI